MADSDCLEEDCIDSDCLVERSDHSSLSNTEDLIDTKHEDSDCLVDGSDRSDHSLLSNTEDLLDKKHEDSDCLVSRSDQHSDAESLIKTEDETEDEVPPSKRLKLCEEQETSTATFEDAASSTSNYTLDLTQSQPITNKPTDDDDDISLNESECGKVPRKSSDQEKQSSPIQLKNDSDACDLSTSTCLSSESITCPVSYRLPHPIAEKLDYVLNKGLVSETGIFSKVIENTCDQLIEHPKIRPHDPDVQKYLDTLQFYGGNAVNELFVGPLNHGQGSNNETPKINMGGPSYRTRARHGDGYTLESGTIKPAYIQFYEALIKSSSVCESDKISLGFAISQNDGTLVKSGLSFDPVSNVIVGKCDGVIKYEFVQENEFNPEVAFNNIDLKQKLVTEAVVTVSTSADGKTCSVTDVEYVSKAGKTGANLAKASLSSMRIKSKCERCLKQSVPTHQILTEDTKVDNCVSSCQICLDKACGIIREGKTDELEQFEVCAQCSEKGWVSWAPLFNPCLPCVAAGVKCRKLCFLVEVVDGESGNKSQIKLFKDKSNESVFLKQNQEYSEMMLLKADDAVHVGKCLKCALCNWWVLLPNEDGSLCFSNLNQIRVLREICRKLRKITKLETVLNKDRMLVESVSELVKVLPTMRELVNGQVI